MAWKLLATLLALIDGNPSLTGGFPSQKASLARTSCFTSSWVAGGAMALTWHHCNVTFFQVKHSTWLFVLIFLILEKVHNYFTLTFIFICTIIVSKSYIVTKLGHICGFKYPVRDSFQTKCWPQKDRHIFCKIFIIVSDSEQHFIDQASSCSKLIDP